MTEDIDSPAAESREPGPAEAPDMPEPHGRLSRWLNAAIDDRGGGYYGILALITFLILEVRMLWAEWLDADSLESFLTQLGFEALLGFSAESVIHAVWASIWPFYWYTHLGVNAVWLALIAWLVYRAGAVMLGSWLPAARDPAIRA